MFSPIFTEGVWNTSFRSDLKSYCDKIRNTQGGRVLTNKGGYQSNNLNMADPELQPLISHLETEALNYNRVYENTIDSLKVTNLWININGYKDYNTEHLHANALYSGVYYVNAPKDCGNIEFLRGNIKLMAYDWNYEYMGTKRFNNHNAHHWFLPAEQHKCYIFPSFYIHRVNPNLNPHEERYSISFNLDKLSN